MVIVRGHAQKYSYDAQNLLVFAQNESFQAQKTSHYAQNGIF